MEIKFFENSFVSDLIGVDVDQLPYTYLSSFRDFVKKTYGTDIIIALAKKEGIFVALSKHKTKFIINAQLLSEPFCMGEPLEENKQAEFFTRLVSAMKKQNIADRFITPQNFVVFGSVPSEAESCKFGSYIIDLTPPVEELYAKVHPKHRNKISKADRAGVKIRSGREELKTFYGLYAATMNRSGMYCEPFGFFQSLYNQLGEDHCVCTVVYHNELPQGAILAPFTKYCCYYVYGASADNITESGSINFLHWETMLIMKKMGVKRYDFVGARLTDVSNTKLEGIQSFKERFGGNLRKGYLFKMDINQTKCNMFDSLLSISNKVRGRKVFKDIIDQEIEKERA